MNLAQQHKMATDVGRVESVTNEICILSGLGNAALNDVVEFSSGQHGIILGFNQQDVQAILLGDYHKVSKGELVRIVQKGLQVNTSMKLLGRVIDPLGNPLDGLGSIEVEESRYIESQAKSIKHRTYVDRPLYSGFMIIDSQVPVGRGQRELLVGVKKSGKIEVAIEALCTQKKSESGVLGVYVAIDADVSSTKRHIRRLREAGAIDQCVVIVGRSSDPASLNYIAPMVGVTIAESFASKNKDVLLIFDNLTSHAKVYRQISLLLGRPAGREAYPGDIFYLHARLLERCGAFNAEAGGGSITALPIVETQSDEVTDYITTNLMSITDGHILFRQNLVNKGIQPAVDSGFSVSRIAGRAQTPIMRHLSDELRKKMIQYNELERYMSFGTDIQKEAQQVVDLGKRITRQFNQPYRETYLPHEQAMLIYMLVSEHVLYWDEEQVELIRQQLLQFIQKPEWRSQIDLAMSMSDAGEAMPIFENIMTTFRNDSQTLKPAEKSAPSVAESETIIDLLRDSDGASNAIGKP